MKVYAIFAILMTLGNVSAEETACKYSVTHFSYNDGKPANIPSFVARALKKNGYSFEENSEIHTPFSIEISVDFAAHVDNGEHNFEVYLRTDHAGILAAGENGGSKPIFFIKRRAWQNFVKELLPCHEALEKVKIANTLFAENMALDTAPLHTFTHDTELFGNNSLNRTPFIKRGGKIYSYQNNYIIRERPENNHFPAFFLPVEDTVEESQKPNLIRGNGVSNRAFSPNGDQTCEVVNNRVICKTGLLSETSRITVDFQATQVKSLCLSGNMACFMDSESLYCMSTWLPGGTRGGPWSVTKVANAYQPKAISCGDSSTFFIDSEGLKLLEQENGWRSAVLIDRYL